MPSRRQGRSSMDCSTLVPTGCCMISGGPGHLLNNSVHKVDHACTTSWPCLCLDSFCNSCSVRSQMRIFRATCSPCEYGTVSPSFVYFPLVFSNIAMDARPYEKWIKNFCIDCTTLAESVGALIACGRGKIEVPRGVMVTLHCTLWIMADRRCLLGVVRTHPPALGRIILWEGMAWRTSALRAMQRVLLAA